MATDLKDNTSTWVYTIKYLLNFRHCHLCVSFFHLGPPKATPNQPKQSMKEFDAREKLQYHREVSSISLGQV
jgi:hypothetical protein